MSFYIISLKQEEGEFYNVPVVPEGEDIADSLKKMLRVNPDSSSRSRKVSQDPTAAQIIPTTGAIKLDDFNFIMVLGKGSFGKVRDDLSLNIMLCVANEADHPGYVGREERLRGIVCDQNSQERHYHSR